MLETCIAETDDLCAWLHVFKCHEKQSQFCHIRETEPEVVLHSIPLGLPLASVLSLLSSLFSKAFVRVAPL